MASILPGYEYDIFISYRQKDNKGDRWVSEFVDALKDELESTFKEEISVYFDINPHNGLLETHDVDESLKEKLKCLVFIPIISRTYCDPKSFAWEHEFKAFIEQASQDQFGLKVKLQGGNVANRILPVQIHDLDEEDNKLCESIIGGVLRGVEFIYKSPGVNRPLRSIEDKPKENLNNTIYRDQINKVALAIKEIISAINKYDKEDAEDEGESIVEKSEITAQKSSGSPGFRERYRKPKRRTILVSALLLAIVIIVITLIVFNIIGGGKQARAGSIDSVVVLPFGNYTGADELESLVSGMHTCLISDMGRLSGLRVINTTTSNVYKNASMSAHEIAVELDVDAVIEVSVLSIRDSIILKVSLIRAFPEEETVWNGDYKEEKSQIMNLYNRITKQIADEVKIELTTDEESLLAENRTVNPEAYDAYLMGKFFWEKLDPESVQKALEYFQLAVQIEPEWADPYAGLANAWSTFGTFFRTLPKSVTLPKTYEYLNKALELDPNSAQAHYVKAIFAVWTEFDWEKGEKAFLKSIELNPNDALCRLYYAHLLMILRRSEEAIHQANLGLRLDPLKPLVLGLYAVVMRNESDYQSAILNFEKALSIDPNFGFAAGNLSDIQMQTAYTNGDYERWIEYWEKKVRAGKHWNEEGISAVLNTFHEKGLLSAFEEMFKMNEKYGNGCYMSGAIKAERYIRLGKYDKALECLEKDFEMRDMNMTYISTNVYIFNQLKDNPRYIELLKKMNLPLDD
ncbi:MAG TPA: tetratricopeptide repeat protein [Bacteroidales bacterium]|nr:tetratricopeptide repeat protein [Bacteroidales bacterium]